MTEMRILTSDHLRAGDILLHQPGKPKWYEKGIAVCTGSPYTHASIFIGDETIAEARLPMVRTCSVWRPIKREKALCVLRQHSDLTADQVGKLKTFVENALSRKARFDFAFPFTYYSRRLMFRLSSRPKTSEQLGPLDPANLDRYFCASFIVDAFCAMGLIDQSEQALYRLGRHAAVDLLTDKKFGYVVGHLAVRGSQEKNCPTFNTAEAK